MRKLSNIWAVALAGGDGSRLREITTTAAGEIVPKQFCSLQSHTCLLEDAIKRAHTVASPAHTCTVVAEQHRRWWSSALSGMAGENIFVQPRNRGTAHGILFALIQIERRDPDSVVALLPADHYVTDEPVMARSLRTAAALANENQGLVYLLGAEPNQPDVELGYIVPSARRWRGAAGVVRFIEKPSLERARDLLEKGALCNTFIFAGSVHALLNLFDGRFESSKEAMRQAIDLSKTEIVGNVALEILYEDLRSQDFSRDVLQHHAEHLQLLSVPKCGWTDLGTPHQVEEVVRNLVQLRPSVREPPPTNHRYFDLAASRRQPSLSAGS